MSEHWCGGPARPCDRDHHDAKRPDRIEAPKTWDWPGEDYGYQLVDIELDDTGGRATIKWDGDDHGDMWRGGDRHHKGTPATWWRRALWRLRMAVGR